MIGDSIGAAVGAEKRRKEAAAEAKRAREDRERGLNMAAEAEYDPFLVSQQIAPYQRSQSPVARGFLESLLTGQNPAAIQGTRQTAPEQRAVAQRGFDQAYGGWDKLQADQRAMEKSTPWEVKPFTEPAVNEEMRSTAKFGGKLADAYDLDDRELAELERAGITWDPAKQKFKGSGAVGKGELSWLEKAYKGGDSGVFDRYANQVGDARANGEDWLARTWFDDKMMARRGAGR